MLLTKREAIMWTIYWKIVSRMITMYWPRIMPLHFCFLYCVWQYGMSDIWECEYGMYLFWSCSHLHRVQIKIIQSCTNKGGWPEQREGYPPFAALMGMKERKKVRKKKKSVDRCWKRWYYIQAVSENNAKRQELISSSKITYKNF